MSFEEILLEAIDEGLSLLGESSKHAIYFEVENNFKISKQDIPYKIEEFTDAIERIFGNGSKILEIQIMKHLFKKIGYTFKHSPRPTSLAFTEYVKSVKIAKDSYEKFKEQQLNLDHKQDEKKIICLRTR